MVNMRLDVDALGRTFNREPDLEVVKSKRKVLSFLIDYIFLHSRYEL
jgi:hypothetical protein